MSGVRAMLNDAEHELAAAEFARSAANETAQEMALRWNRAQLDGSPSQASLDRAKSSIVNSRNALQALGERQRVLAKDNEDALLQSEVTQVLAAMRQAASERGTADPSAYLAGLEVKAAAARADAKLTIATRNAVQRYTEQLKTRADDFSNRVLNPLNLVIDDFNEAILSTPGETIQFKADTCGRD
jgi:hypothetical protein